LFSLVFSFFTSFSPEIHFSFSFHIRIQYFENVSLSRSYLGPQAAELTPLETSRTT
jgi:hypothetical protein